MDRDVAVDRQLFSGDHPSPPFGVSFTYIVSVYIVAVCTLYLWGYWSHFNLNILEFVGVTDIVRVAAYPLVSSVFVVFVGGLLGAWMPTELAGKTYEKKPSKRTQDIFLWVALGLPLASFFLWELLPAEKWLFAPMFLTPFIAMWVCIKTKIGEWFGVSVNQAFYAVLLIVGVAWSSFGFGRDAAIEITAGDNFSYFVGNPAETDDVIKQKRYIGYAGGYFFMYDPQSKGVLLTKADDLKQPMLKHYKKHSTTVRPLPPPR